MRSSDFPKAYRFSTFLKIYLMAMNCNNSNLNGTFSSPYRFLGVLVVPMETK